MIRANQSAFASGMTGCGKSQLLWDLFTSRHPRVVSYDPVGDTFDRNPQAVPVRTADEFRQHLARATASGCDSWHFVVWGEPEEAAKVLEMLCPDTAGPQEKTLGRLLGGVMFETGEIDTLGANNTAPLSVRVRSRWQRGRHSLLSFGCATQAPALVSRVITGNSKHIYAFGHSEATSLKYFSETIGERAADAIARLQQFAFVHYEKGSMFAEEYRSDTKGGKIVRTKVRAIPLIVGWEDHVTEPGG